MQLFAKTLKRALVVIFLVLLDFSLLVGGCLAAFHLRFRTKWAFFPVATTQDTSSYWFALAIAVYLVFAQILAYNLYSFDRFRTWKEDFYGVIRAVTFATVLLLSLSFFYRNVQFSRQMVIMAWPLTMISMCLGRAFFRGSLAFLRRKGLVVRRVLLIGHGTMLPVVLDKIAENKSLGLSISGILMEDTSSTENTLGFRCLGSFADLGRVLVQQEIKIAILGKEGLPQERMLELIEICERLHVELFLVPQVFDLLIGHSGLRDLEGLPMMELREEPLVWGTLLIKRIGDFCLGLVLLLVTLPLQAVLGLAIRLDSKGPALFLQERVGYRGKIFRMWKFRTMVLDAEERLEEFVDVATLKEPVFKIKGDPRVTRLGAFLRRSSLDELPQLWNVVIGQMSLVGPRPEEVQLAERYNVWQRRRLKVKPGITGLQQIKCRGASSLSERVKYDIYYIRRLSLLLDAEILVKTIWVVLKQEGAS